METSRRTKVWWVGALAIAGCLVSVLAAGVCLSQAQTPIWLPPSNGSTQSIETNVTNGGMIAWGVTAVVCAVAYAIAAVLAFTRGLSTRSWLPLVCLAFPAVMAWFAGASFTAPVG
ncbi:hypothetical protein ACSDQ9_03370 [Aestuariimicrobium soli]|uniref:hypothetical protein n=1 Tax=Aestuariimicrobium soli TaxID=2035834 RepID=UPI003EBB0F10